MIIFKQYRSEDQRIWDDFVGVSKNANFLFYRDYMDYHSSRFNDHSLLIYEDAKLIALLPAHLQDEELCSHNGLTFAGLLTDNSMKAHRMYDLITAIKEYLSAQGLEALKYKAIPHIYHKRPAEEDLYALHRHEAKLLRRDITSVIALNNALAFAKARRGCIKKAKQAGLNVQETKDLSLFFEIMNELLKNKYNTNPVHSLSEMQLLQSRFPENIKLYATYRGQEILAGILIYESETVAKTQYISSTEAGRELGAVDIIVDKLVHEIYSKKLYFDFGSSVDESPLGFNEGLLSQKELFGARAVAADTYYLSVT
jgi:hypothetical protein